LADKSAQLLLGALSRAAADPTGVPLHGTKTQPGLFAATAVGRQVAQRCKDEGYLRVLEAETRGKASHELCTITEKGLAYLLSQTSPRRVLEDFIRSLDARQGPLDELVAAARQMQSDLETFKGTAEKVLQQLQQPAPPPSVNGSAVHNGSENWVAAALSHLERWQTSGASEDCPLPELYRQVCLASPDLSIGRYHDGLRRLHDQEQIYLHPWTGPLYDLPEPPYALLIGHEIAYYASLRQG
jgi:hypothetical protein